jgi:uncharacterized membrane protein YphA (DoxX/SURF4 family)
MSAAAGIVLLLGRIVFAVYFAWVAGVSHVRNRGMYEGGARAARFPLPGLAGWPAGLWLIAGGLSLGLGVWPDVGALMIGVFVIPAAAWFHRFWRVEDPNQKRVQQQLFWRNVIALGAVLMVFGAFAALGPALRFSITAPLFQF